MMEKSKVSRAASRLEAAGYVRKDVPPTDRRLVRLSLTPKGQALMRDLIPVAMAYQAELETLLGPAMDDLEAGLQRLLALRG